MLCFKWKNPIRDLRSLRSFKCHNLVYARGELLKILAQIAED